MWTLLMSISIIFLIPRLLIFHTDPLSVCTRLRYKKRKNNRLVHIFTTLSSHFCEYFQAHMTSIRGVVGRWVDSWEINETGFTVSRQRLRLAFIESQFQNQDLHLSTTKQRPRFFSKSQPQVSKSRLRPRFFQDSCGQGP